MADETGPPPAAGAGVKKLFLSYGRADATDSVCLDEIAYARFAANKPIVPLMAIPCEPPFEIFRPDYVDFTAWWTRPMPSALALSTLVDEFVSNPAAAAFAAVHVVGEPLAERQSKVPLWVTDAKRLRDLAMAFQWPLADFTALNPKIPDPDLVLAPGTPVRVPDREFTPMLAAYLASLVMRAPAFSKDDRVRLILRVSAHATQQVTALDTVLARLLLVLQPDQPGSLDEIEQSVRTYQPTDPSVARQTAPPYPMA